MEIDNGAFIHFCLNGTFFDDSFRSFMLEFPKYYYCDKSSWGKMKYVHCDWCDGRKYSKILAKGDVIEPMD